MSVGSPRQRLVSGVFWMTVSRALSQSITWVITIFVVRLLAPGDYGLMGMAVLFSGFLSLFAEIGLGIAIIQRADLRDDHLARLRCVIFGVNFLIFLILLFGAPAVASYFREARLVPLVQTLAVSFVMQGIGAPSGYLLQRRMAFRDKAGAEFVGSVAGGVATLAMAWTGAGVWSLVLGYLLQHCVVNALYCLRAPLLVGFDFSLRGLREFVNFGGQVALSRVLWYLASNADFMIVGRWLGSVQLGYYSLAFQFSTLPIDKLVTIVSQVAFPAFSSMQDDNTSLTRFYLKLTGVVALVTFPMLIGLSLVASTAVEVFLTSKWLPIVTPLQLLCIAACFRAVEMLNAPLVVAKGKPSLSAWNSLIQLLLLPGALLVGIRYGLPGVALAWVITRPFIFAFMTLMSVRLLEIRFASYLNALKHPALGCLAMAIVVLPLQEWVLLSAPLPIRLALACVLGAAAYGGYQWLFNAETIREAVNLFRAHRQRPRAAGARPGAELTPGKEGQVALSSR